MNKNILLAGILSLVAIMGTVTIYNRFFLPEKTETSAVSDSETALEKAVLTKNPPEPQTGTAGAEPAGEDASFLAETADPKAAGETFPVWETPEYKAVFSSRGGRLVSLELKNYQDALTEKPVDLVKSGTSGRYPLELHLGNFRSPVLDLPMNVEKKETSLVFSGTYGNGKGQELLVEKSITFAPGEYLFKVELKIRPGQGSLPGASDGSVAALTLGPLLGPEIEVLDGKLDYRYFFLQKEGRKSYFKPEPDGYTVMTGEIPYLGLDGRYFTSFILPGDFDGTVFFDSRPLEGISPPLSYGINWTLPAESGSSRELHRVLYLYMGPKDAGYLSLYDKAEKNAFGLENRNLTEILGQTKVLRNLSGILNAVLNFLYGFIPNYGIVIILLAMILELCMIPLTRKASLENIRVAQVYPQIRALKKQYGFNKSLMNQKISELFRQKGIKPRPGSRSLVLHLPVFILLYFLFTVSIDLRMSVFIPGWIPDLSRPESIWNFSPFIMPITRWSDVRFLPILLLVLSLYQSRKVQPPEETLTAMRNMSILMPVILFLVVYNMPAGAVLYWITHTSLSIVLQLLMKRKLLQEGAG